MNRLKAIIRKTYFNISNYEYDIMAGYARMAGSLHAILADR